MVIARASALVELETLVGAAWLPAIGDKAHNSG